MADWAIKLDGQEPFRLDDLPPKDVVKLAAKHGLSWLVVIDAPGADPDACADLIELVAAKLGVEAPARPETIRDARRMIDERIVAVDSDMPGMWADGNPPEGDQTTD